MLEILRFSLFLLFLLAGLIVELTAVLGVNRFGYAMNRLHPAGMGDTLAMLFFVLAAVVYSGFDMIVFKMILILAFLWITSPVCGHLIGRLIRETDEDFGKETEAWRS